MNTEAVPFSTRIRRLLALFGLLAFAVVFLISGLFENLQFKAEVAAVMKCAATESGSLLRESIMQHRRYILELVEEMPAASDETVSRYFSEHLPLLGPEDCYFVLNQEGRVIHASRRAEEFIGLDFSHLLPVRDDREISGVHQSFATLKPVVTIKFKLPHGRLMLVERDLFSLAPLVGHLNISGSLENGMIFVLSSNGTVIYHPDSRLVSNRSPLGFELQHWSDADANGLQEYTLRGERYVCYREAFQVPEGWIFYASVPRREFIAHIVRQLVFQALAIAALFAVMFVLLEVLIGRKVSRPISTIAAQLSTLNPLADKGIGISGRDDADTVELVQIIEAYQRMAANIRASNEKLMEREELFRTVTEFATDWTFWLDPDERFVYISPSCEAFTGYTAEEFYDRPELMQAIVHPADREKTLTHIHRAAHDLPHAPLEYRIVAKDGTIRWLSHICRPIHDAAGSFLGVRGSNSDITERKRAEETLRESEERFRSLVEQALDGIFLHDLDGRIIDVNPSGYRMLGFNRDELLGMNIADIESGIDPRTLKDLWTILKSGEARVVQGRALRKDGFTFPVEVQLGLVQWGERQMVLAMVRDISERKQAEDALAAEKELLAVTLRSIGDGVITTDQEGKVLLLSRIAEKLTGWSEEEARGKPLHEVMPLVHRVTRQRLESPVRRVLDSGQIVFLDSEALLIARDGTERLIADSGAPIRDPRSRVIGVVVVFRDITTQQRLEEELHKAQKLESLGVLAGGIAHDFNNLLTGILGNISMAKLDAADAAMHQQLEAAGNAALRAQGLTHQLLTFAKGGAPIKTVAAIADLVRESAEFALHGSRVGYTFRCGDDLWPVEVDASQMSQVINNLVLNAVQAMPGGGGIAVTLENVNLAKDAGLPLAPGPYVLIRVADQGVGIDPAHLGRIFDPYFSTREEGTGLGLASTYSIIKRHEGHIDVASKPGKGTTFAIWLPASPGKAIEQPTAVGTPVCGQGRILVMDDEAMVRELARAVLERLGYEADFAEDGEAAMALYRQAQAAGRAYDVVIMDLTIPGGMGGQEAIEELLRINPQAKAIVSSGYAQDPVMANYRDYGFRAVLAKPYSVEALSKVLHRLLQENDELPA